MDEKIKRSRAQEERGAKLHGGRRRPASGAFDMAKGDMRTDDEMVEYKRTNGKQITIKLDDLEKNRREALVEGRMPLLGFELGGRDYLIVEAGDWEERQASAASRRARVDRRPVSRPLGS
jgi:hypothetical protein